MHKVLRVTCIGFMLAPAMALNATAGGFGVREQSTALQGMSFAGNAAGGELSSMYWNSAAAAYGTGCNSSSNLAIASVRLKETAEGGRLVTGTPAGNGLPAVPGSQVTSADVGSLAGIPASYMNCQLSRQLYFGLGINAPFAAATKPDNRWAGSTVANTTKILTTNINPALAYKLTPELTIGVGAQIQHMSLHLTRYGLFSVASPTVPLAPPADFTADGWAVGFTAGALWQPTHQTTLGIGYRSAITQDIEGSYTRGASLAAGPAREVNGKSEVKLPDILTLSIRHQATQRLAVLGTFEWSNWSRIGQSVVTSGNCTNGICDRLQLDYSNGYMFSIGAEYAMSPALTLRGGVAYERSPVTNSVRDIAVPDSSRIMTSVGLSYKVTDNATMDLAYSHIFFDDATFCLAQRELNGGSSHCSASTPAAAVLLKGSSDNAIDLFSLGLKYKF